MKMLEMEFALTAAQFPNPRVGNWNSGLITLAGLTSALVQNKPLWFKSVSADCRLMLG
jgi:hypothetical protein